MQLLVSAVVSLQHQTCCDHEGVVKAQPWVLCSLVPAPWPSPGASLKGWGGVGKLSSSLRLSLPASFGKLGKAGSHNCQGAEEVLGTLGLNSLSRDLDQTFTPPLLQLFCI